jgi:hypothetical protein
VPFQGPDLNSSRAEHGSLEEWPGLRQPFGSLWPTARRPVVRQRN